MRFLVRSWEYRRPRLWVGVRVACGIFNVVLGVVLLASLRWLGPLAWLAQYAGLSARHRHLVAQDRWTVRLPRRRRAGQRGHLSTETTLAFPAARSGAGYDTRYDFSA
jgi:hypothetical protein